MDSGAVELVYIALLMRAVPILCGFGSVCFGFYLFIKGVGGVSSGSGGWGGIRFVVRRAAPGVFFVVLGAMVMVATILHSSVKVRQTGKPGSLVEKGNPSFTIDLEARSAPRQTDVLLPADAPLTESERTEELLDEACDAQIPDQQETETPQ